MKILSFTDKVYQRLFMLCVMALTHLMAFATDDFDDDGGMPALLPDDEEDEMLENFGFHFGTMEIILVVAAVVLYLVLNKLKVKKGCWYCIFYLVFVYLLITKCT